ncbi:hypothetical protein J7E78_02730 [Paenibacillus polymyxa]|uniref:hypothetical protein n=1 Tax=Paenibacillus polymyxa TaxID=1406 RepID=UPI001BEAC643|nr:hypothetical protein [Paenibacillus polymyxa]MBT2282469.1 hypothetical protein [Paenibacillus polymyxa]
MSWLTVLGIGSQLMGNDGTGVYVVEALRVMNTDEHVTYIAGETDIDFCLQYIENATFSSKLMQSFQKIPLGQ